MRESVAAGERRGQGILYGIKYTLHTTQNGVLNRVEGNTRHSLHKEGPSRINPKAVKYWYFIDRTTRKWGAFLNEHPD